MGKAQAQAKVWKAHFNPTLVQLESWLKNDLWAFSGIDFNPTLVQLESRFQVLLVQTYEHFNPTLVQLELFFGTLRLRESISFQSHIGAIRIKTARVVKPRGNQYFNPTLVQLECALLCCNALLCCEFQSHIGAIRIAICASIQGANWKFQSHIGAIRITDRKFNAFLAKRFQSHIGAIRIKRRFIVTSKPYLYFNPTLVQLEFCLWILCSLSKVKISIPHWCN